MLLPHLLPLLPLTTLPALASANPNPSNEADHLQLTALVTSPDGVAAFECWRIDAPFVDYPTIGKTIPDFAQVSNVSYVVLPPRSMEDLHNPPHPMLFVLLSGAARVNLPPGRGQHWIVEGVNGMLVAADVRGFGHYTSYPSDKHTVALQIPFEGGRPPAHTVVRKGACALRMEDERRREEAVEGARQWILGREGKGDL